MTDETPRPTQDRVLIVDFGSQVTQLIARRVREAGVYSEIVPYDKAEGALGPVAPKAIILSGGPASVHETGTPLAVRNCCAVSSARQLLDSGENSRTANPSI